MYTRDCHKKQFVKHRSQYHWKHYQAARNKVNIEMPKSKSNYFQQKIKDCEKIDPKVTWKLINSLVGKSHKSNHVTKIELEGMQWRKFTFSVGRAKPPKFPTKLSNFLQTPPPHLLSKRLFLAFF
jgi:hypothetical protein